MAAYAVVLQNTDAKSGGGSGQISFKFAKILRLLTLPAKNILRFVQNLVKNPVFRQNRYYSFKCVWIGVSSQYETE